ncbi:hypothetical protein JCM18899A_41030 [Nocardioides sp. AN3]
MCRPTRCRTCGKVTWTGCGRHVAQVKAGVPADEWCAGHDAPGGDRRVRSGNDGWLRRALGR